ncbi:MAG: glycosyltransferase family 4 protein [Thermomicrobiales bacterium]
MHIGVIAPPWFVIPPVKYGGIERVIHDVVEPLIAAGHNVTLFAAEGSQTSATLVPVTASASGLDLNDREKSKTLERAVGHAFEQAVELGVDIIHDHTDFDFPGTLPVPVVRTIHGPVTDHALDQYRKMTEQGDWFLAISHRQRERFARAASIRFGPGEHIRFAGVIHNPVDVASIPYSAVDEKADWVAFVGRCHWEKGPAEAIQIAMDAGISMKMALRVSEIERPYFEFVVEPLLRRAGNLVEFVGEVGGRDRSKLFGEARALVFSSVWEEPFGLTMTEALSHGTPVIALRRGASPEIVVDGATGILCDDTAEMARRLPEAMQLEPARCREDMAKRFDRGVIAEQHVALFREIVGLHKLRVKSALPGQIPGSLSVPPLLSDPLVAVPAVG